MQVARVVLSIFFVFVFCVSLSAQQTPTSSPQALTLLQKSLAALTGGQSINDVTLSGTARRIAGSDDESGPAVFKALGSGSNRLDLSLPAGPRSEIRSVSADGPAGSWSGPDGVSHPMAYHNLISEPVWFFPAITLAQSLLSSAYVATYVGEETHDSATVEHISISQVFHTSSRSVAAHQRLSQVEIYLDSAKLLPATLTFNVHPDDDASRNIPIEIRLSDYRPVNGALIPFASKNSSTTPFSSTSNSSPFPSTQASRQPPSM